MLPPRQQLLPDLTLTRKPAQVSYAFRNSVLLAAIRSPFKNIDTQTFKRVVPLVFQVVPNLLMTTLAGLPAPAPFKPYVPFVAVTKSIAVFASPPNTLITTLGQAVITPPFRPVLDAAKNAVVVPVSVQTINTLVLTTGAVQPPFIPVDTMARGKGIVSLAAVETPQNLLLRNLFPGVMPFASTSTSFTQPRAMFPQGRTSGLNLPLYVSSPVAITAALGGGGNDFRKVLSKRKRARLRRDEDIAHAAKTMAVSPIALTLVQQHVISDDIKLTTQEFDDDDMLMALLLIS